MKGEWKELWSLIVVAFVIFLLVGIGAPLLMWTFIQMCKLLKL